MKLKVQLVSVIDGHEEMREVADLEREALEPETLGLGCPKIGLLA